LVEIAVSPGAHQLTLTRPGYRSLAREIVVPEAGALEVTEKLTFDVKSRNGHQGSLEVRPSEDAAVVFVNGAAVSGALVGVQLPEGSHRLRVERAGFVSSERTIQIPRGKAAIIDVTLTPTAAYRADYSASATARRGWALGVGIGGLVLASASTGYVIWNGGQVRDAQRDFDAAYAVAFQACTERPSDCDELTTVATIREEDLNDKKQRQLLGWVGVGVGAAGIATGAVLWLTGKDPHRYDPKPESDVFGSLDWTPWLSPAGGGLQLSTSL
jgi:hypothetical protein